MTTMWVLAAHELPPPRTLVVGCWPHKELTGGVGHHHVVDALRHASYQVCYHSTGQWFAFYCGGYDAQLVPPTYWSAVHTEFPSLAS